MINNHCSEHSHLRLFTAQKERLFAIAYQMLGTFHEAEDVLQEVYIQWQSMNLERVDLPEAMLTTLTIRRATDMFRKASRQREVYIGPWLPGPWIEQSADPSSHSNEPDLQVQLADSLSIGFMIMLERLTASERAVYILRSGFDMSYREIAESLAVTEVNCRQIYSRAKSRLKASSKEAQNTDNHESLLQKFIHAIETEDVSGFARELAKDVILYSDGGGKVNSALRPIYNREKVTRLLRGLAKKWRRIGPKFRMLSVNARPGLLWMDSEDVRTVVSLESRRGKVEAIYLIRNPDKISHIKNRLQQPLDN
ncbi:RNA polymerase sigma factor SigJ [Gilvimarinus algae]|uniref:RNA polymerase sigma factor SigJ n=1 Tax=Gilvimarinus algae TaxID=3058037 RepID=A0ABT8TKT8_9GAMM|nr:RNA polymerase sigma factor SigJ [Gilvimarinus sp. SDUM040014]MDO3383728.1 RNA polymerase sigma factor SigJ [Gilvimarinus sp. SDUM040014]